MQMVLRSNFRACEVPLGGVVALVAGCSGAPVVAEGRYVEIATHRSEPICAGTVARIDDHLDAIADTLGEELPDRRFIRIEWRELEPAEKPHTRDYSRGDDVIITDDLFDEHELVHAVHPRVWPKTHVVLQEGLATMLGSSELLSLAPWPDGAPIDALFDDWTEDYVGAQFFVSQIVVDHGFDGLRRLWRGVLPEMDATEIRAVYEREFGRPLDVLFEPVQVGPVPERRFSCFYEVCSSEVVEPDGAQWSASGPSSCGSDPNAVGPRPRGGRLSAWTFQTLEIEAESQQVETVGGEGAIFRWCGLGCTDVVHDAWLDPDETMSTSFVPGSYSVEIGHPLDGLPADPPARVGVLLEQ